MTLSPSPQTRRVFRLSLPIFAELLLQLLVGNMDQFMISHFGSAAVASIGNGNQVMNVVIIVLETMSAATTILLTQHIGAGRTGRPCDEIATVGTAVTAVFSLAMGLFLLLAPPGPVYPAADAGGRLCRGLSLHPHRGRSGLAPGALHRAVRHTAELYPPQRGGDRLRGDESFERGGQRRFDQRLLRPSPDGGGRRRRVHLPFQGGGSGAGDLDPAPLVRRPLLPQLPPPLSLGHLQASAGHRHALRHGVSVLQYLSNLHPALYQSDGHRGHRHQGLRQHAGQRGLCLLHRRGPGHPDHPGAT